MNGMPGCWVKIRHNWGIERYRCGRVSVCNQPQKTTCPATKAEQDYLKRQAETTKYINELKGRIKQ